MFEATYSSDNTGIQGAALQLKRLCCKHYEGHKEKASFLLAPDAELSRASQEEQKQALHISQEIGGLPLALDQTGAYLEETGTNLAVYWQIS